MGRIIAPFGMKGAAGGLADVYANLNGSSMYFYRSDADFPESGITGATDLTIQGWVMTTDISATQGIVSKFLVAGDKRMYYLTVLNPGRVRFFVSSDGTVGNTTNATSTGSFLVNDVWMHIAVVYDASAGTVDFYSNGSFVNQVGSQKNSIADKDPNFTIGARSDGSAYWSGGLDNFALFDDKRTAPEIAASAATRNIDLSAEGNLVAQWRLNDVPAATAIDNEQGDAGRDLIPYNGGDTTYSNCGRTVGRF